MKIVIAPDSFKGTNTSIDVCNLIETGILRVFPDADIRKIPVADGGEGTVDAVISAVNGKTDSLEVTGPLGKPVSARFGYFGKTAVMEMAEASGLTLIQPRERNPLRTTTRGTGELLKHLVEKGFTKIILGVGGSATNDGGAGMAQGLGYILADSTDRPLEPGGAHIGSLGRITDSPLRTGLDRTEIIIAGDVTNPLLGPDGASAVYGPQKGADPETVSVLERNMTDYSKAVETYFGRSFRSIPGAGAAGGLGFGLLAFCDARIQSGIDTVLDIVGFNRLLNDADIVITGEGRIDGQSLKGKVAVGIAQRCRKHNVPVLVIAGSIGESTAPLYECGISGIMSTVRKVQSLEEALAEASPCLVDAAERAMRLIKIGMLF
jgi:glycerate kinase